jgi:predicted PurR-regulated permease PerM
MSGLVAQINNIQQQINERFDKLQENFNNLQQNFNMQFDNLQNNSNMRFNILAAKTTNQRIIVVNRLALSSKPLVKEVSTSQLINDIFVSYILIRSLALDCKKLLKSILSGIYYHRF